MRKSFLLAFLLAAPLSAQTTTYVGTVKDLTGTTITSGRITWQLNAPTAPVIPGKGAFVSTIVSCLIDATGLPVSTTDGVSPCVVTNNTALTPTGTSYRMCYQPYNITPGSCINTFANGGTVDVSTIIPTPATQPNYGISVALVPGGSNTQVQYNNNGTLGGAAATIDAAGNFNTPTSATAANVIPGAINSTPYMSVAQLTAADGCAGLATAIATKSANGIVNASAHTGTTLTCTSNPFVGLLHASKHFTVDIGSNLFQTTVQWVIPAQMVLQGSNPNLANGVQADPTWVGEADGCNVTGVSAGVATIVCPTATSIVPHTFFFFNGTGTDFDTSYEAQTVSTDHKTITVNYGGALTSYTSSTMTGCTSSATAGTNVVTVACTSSDGLTTGDTVYLSGTGFADLKTPTSAITVASTPTGSSFTFNCFSGSQSCAGIPASGTKTWPINANSGTVIFPPLWLGDADGTAAGAVAGTQLRNIRVSCNGLAANKCPVNIGSTSINESSGLFGVQVGSVARTGVLIKQTTTSWSNSGGFPENYNLYDVKCTFNSNAAWDASCIDVENSGDLPHSIDTVTANSAGASMNPAVGIQYTHAVAGILSNIHVELFQTGLQIYSSSNVQVSNLTSGLGAASVTNALLKTDSTDARIQIGVTNKGAATYSWLHNSTGETSINLFGCQLFGDALVSPSCPSGSVMQQIWPTTFLDVRNASEKKFSFQDSSASMQAGFAGSAAGAQVVANVLPVFLRPNGYDTATGQFSVAADGTVTVNGAIKSGASIVWIPAAALGHTGTDASNVVLADSPALTGTPTVNAKNISLKDGTNSSTIPGTLTTTAATTDNLTLTGMTSSGHCSLAATNASAATNLATTYVSAKTTNQITVTHTATASMTYDVLCTVN